MGRGRGQGAEDLFFLVAFLTFHLSPCFYSPPPSLSAGPARLSILSIQVRKGLLLCFAGIEAIQLQAWDWLRDGCDGWSAGTYLLPSRERAGQSCDCDSQNNS